MAIGDTLTLVKIETGIPWYKAFGVMQHLNPSTARTMLQIPWYAWEDNGIETRLQITRIQPQPTTAVRFPLLSIGLKGMSGLGAVANSNNVVTSEGSITANCETQCVESTFGNVDHTIYGGFFQGNTVNMLFYTNSQNDVYVGLSYGMAGNKTTAFKFGYKRNDTGIETTATTSANWHAYPSDIKDLYIDGVSVDPLYNAVALSVLYKACSFDFCVSCSLFATESGYNKFKETGETSEEIEAITNTNPGEDRTTILYLEAQEYKSEFSMRVPSEKVGNKKRIEFYVRNTKDTGEKIQYIDRAVWGFVHNDSVKPTKTELVTPSNIFNHMACNGSTGQLPSFPTMNNRGVVKEFLFEANKTYHITCDNPNLYEIYVTAVDVSTGKILSATGWYNLPHTIAPTTNSKRIIAYRLKTNADFTLSDINPSVYTLEGGGALTDYKNISFVKNNAFEVYKIIENGVDVTLSFDWSKRFTVWKNNILYNNEYYWSDINTNMYIFESYQKGLDAINTGIINNLLNGGFGVGDVVKTEMNTNTLDYDLGLSETWLLEEDDARDVAKYFNMDLNNNNTNIIGDVIVGLSMYQNPIDVIVDFFALPVDVEDFTDFESSSFNFGIRFNNPLNSNE